MEEKIAKIVIESDDGNIVNVPINEDKIKSITYESGNIVIPVFTKESAF